MARMRVGVALLLPSPVADEVDGLRRALGDGSLARIPPHVTLVPPVNIRIDDLGVALAVVRRAAAEAPQGGLVLTLGPVQTFAPASPVVYLGVGGDQARLRALRDRVFTGPLERSLTFPFVPHVTLADEAAPATLEAAAAVLGGYARVAAVERVHLLRELAGRRWLPIADAVLGPPALVGRGGLAVELTESDLVDPEAGPLLERAGMPARLPEGARVVITARREGHVAGTALAWLGPDGGRVEVLVVAEVRGQGIGGHLLAALEGAVRRRQWGCSRLVSRCGPARFYAARSTYSKAIEL